MEARLLNLQERVQSGEYRATPYADVRGFLDAMDHEWLMKFVEHRIADPGMLALISKWLRAGVSEDGQWAM